MIGVVATSGDVFTPAILGKIHRLTQAVKTVPGVLEAQVLSLADRKVKAITAGPPAGDAEEGTIIIRRVMEAVPTTMEEAQAVREAIFANPMYVGTLISEDGTAAAIIADFRGGAGARDVPSQGSAFPPLEGFQGPGMGRDQDPPAETGPSASDPASGGWQGDWQSCPPADQAPWYVPDLMIYNCLTQLVDQERDSSVTIHIGGLPIALAFMEMDTWLMNYVVFPFAFLVVMIVIYAAFRTTQDRVLPIPILTDIVSVVWAFGILGLFQVPLDPWTKALTPILIVAIAAGHSVQILKRYYEEFARLGDHRQAVIESTTKMIPITLTAGLVAAASFASLATFKLQTFQAFGLFTATGILSALVLELTLIPALRVLMRPAARGRQASTGPTRLDRWLERLARLALSPQGRRRVLTAGVLVFVVALIFAARVEVNNSLKLLFFERTDFRRDDAVLNARFAGTNTFYVLLETQEPDGLKAPEVLRAVEALQRRLETMPGVGKTQSYVDYLKRINRTFHGDDPAYERIPETQAEAAQYLFFYSISGNPEDFARLVDSQYQRAVIWVFMKTDESQLTEALIAATHEELRDRFGGRLEQACVGLWAFGLQEVCVPTLVGGTVTAGVAGSAPVVVALNQVIVEGKLANILIIAGMTFAIVALIRRSLLGGLFVMIPLSLAVLVNFGVMGLFGIPLGIGTAAISAMAVGLGADFDIYLLFRFREEIHRGASVEEATVTTLTSAGKAIIFVAAAISLGAATLIFPGYYLHMEGILVPLAMISGCLAALTILPALVLAVRPAFIFTR